MQVTQSPSTAPPGATAAAAAADLADLRRRLSQHDDELKGLAADAEENSSSIGANRNNLVRLSEKVTYFQQNVLKVKKLPAMMNALERRIEALDDNFSKVVLAARPPLSGAANTVMGEERV